MVLIAHARLSAPACDDDKRCGCSPATLQHLRQTGQQNRLPPDSELLYAGKDLCSVLPTLHSSVQGSAPFST